jgi:hypothetical protein
VKTAEIRDLKEDKMFEISEQAKEKVKEFFKKQDLSPIRIIETSG